jgi:hypothetical protein
LRNSNLLIILRAEAATEWEAAKVRFERALFEAGS